MSPNRGKRRRRSRRLDRFDSDAALAQIPEDYRVAVFLRDHLDLEYGEIASFMTATDLVFDGGCVAAAGMAL